MSPYAARIVFYALAASISTLLLKAGGTIDAFAAILIAAGVPAFRMLVQRTFERSGALNLLRAADLSLEDISHSRSTDRASEGRTQVR